MKRLLNASFIYMLAGVASGLFYREFTKLNDFPEGQFTQLGLGSPIDRTSDRRAAIGKATLVARRECGGKSLHGVNGGVTPATNDNRFEFHAFYALLPPPPPSGVRGTASGRQKP